MSLVRELDPVALLTDRPDLGLVRGQMGTAVLELANNNWEVEFDDDQGRAYRLAAVPGAELPALRTSPAITPEYLLDV
jgi:Domain of unknown function (DUF4926)